LVPAQGPKSLRRNIAKFEPPATPTIQIHKMYLVNIFSLQGPKSHGGVELESRLYLNSVLDTGEFRASSSDRFTTRKCSRYPLNKRTSGVQIRSGSLEEGNISRSLRESVRPACSLVTIMTAPHEIQFMISTEHYTFRHPDAISREIF